MDELTPEQLEAILGTDYETILADILRQKASAEDRRHQKRELGQVGDGQVFFDPAGAIGNVMQRRRAGKESAAAQAKMDEVLGKQTAGRRTFAEALTKQPPAPMGAPRSVDSAIPGQAPQGMPQAGVPPMAPGAPPALSNAQQMPPEALQNAGVPPEVQALLAKLRGR